MRGPGQAENPQYGCKVDNKYEVIADGEDPFEALDRLAKGPVVKKDGDGEKSKPRSTGEKQAGSGGGSARKADGKKEAAVASKPQSATTGKQQDAAMKKQAGERGGAQERPKTAGDKPARAGGPQQDQRRQHGGAAARGGALPQQAGVIGLTTAVSGAHAEGAGAAGKEDEHGAANTDGFQPQRFSAGNYRGRRGGSSGGGFYGPGSAGGYRRPYRGGYGGARQPPAASASDAAGGEQDAGDAQQAATGGVHHEGGETDDRVDRTFERRQRPPYGQGGYRGGPGGYGRRGGPRRGGPGGSFEDGTGRKREFERHSGSDVTGVRAVDKKEGSGQHNWGTMHDDLAGQTEAETLPEGAQASGPTNVKEAKAGEAWTDLVHADESAKAAEGTNAEGEQQDKMYVFDDWKAKEEKERFRVPEFNVRKPNEGVDESSKWGGFVLKKREEEAAPAGEEGEVADEDAHRGDDDAKRKAKQRVNIPVEFASAAHRGGGRGAYGGGRGGPRGAGAGAGRPPSSEYREGGDERRGGGGGGGAYRGGYDRPRYDRGGSGGGGSRGGAPRGGYRGGAAAGAAPQLTMDEFPSLNKQAA